MTLRVLAALVSLLLLVASAPARAGLSEAWYLSRGRANMEIGNYAAAIEAFRKALSGDPKSREASRLLGLALLKNGDTDLAVAEFDRHLAAFPDDAEIAFEQARLLQWGRYAYRAGDAARYLRMGLAVREDPARRRDLARLLGRSRATLDEALAEYDRLLAASPDDRTLREERLRLLLWDPARAAEAVVALRAARAERPGDATVTRELARLLAADPRTAAEAAGLYAELLRASPRDPQLRLGRARALARAGSRAEARQAFDLAVEAAPVGPARLERAEFLAADPATREAARRDFEAVLRADPGSRRARVGLAQVLGARQETADQAIVAYREVLARAPDDAAAHGGLAHAYAWTGDLDRALDHADRAGSGAPELDRLRRTLREGREPAVGGGARALAQPGSWALTSIGTFLAGSADPTPYTSSAVEAGYAEHRGEAGASAHGATVALHLAWRPAPDLQLALEGGWDGARPAGTGLSGGASLEQRSAEGGFSVGVLHRARTDAFRAYAGEVVEGQLVGAASDTVGEVRLRRGEELRLSGWARAGAVSGLGFPTTFEAGAGGRVDRVLGRPGGYAVAVGGALDATHHARDLSGRDGDPAAPRLYSPPLFLSASPRLLVERDLGPSFRFTLDGGPAVQLEVSDRQAMKLGGDLRLAWAQRLGRVQLSTVARGERIGASYTRLEAGLTANLLFP